jgi:hypothetical protein
MRRDIERFRRKRALVCAIQLAATVVFCAAECADVRGPVVRLFDYFIAPAETTDG